MKDSTMSYSRRILHYKFMHWLFQWNAEPEEQGGSIVFTIAGILHFVKYKEHTIVYWGQGRKGDIDFVLQPARKYVLAYLE